ncbi:MAG: hypothetical protein HN567_08275 [Actinobacteria bacterium]|nr:hypothetical protein [Actinomycetota bacterium]MDE0927558.1 hypothetical protein [Acidimicrobiales bacterium]MBT3746348.1 hypothetical protein [Actinomycetota bacterium]MBT3969819.1 hypothetical protein [Actinomycetota bacterium]MBT4010225.1 hypothetical protein [Actinomycetota bacterium]
MKNSRTSRLVAILAAFMLLAGCANSSTPNGWDEQDALAERNFVEACAEANPDLSSAQGEALCGCILQGIQDAVTYEEFKALDNHIRENAGELTETGLADGFSWYTDAVVSCQ